MDFEFVKTMHKTNKKVIKYAIFLYYWVYFQDFQHSLYEKSFKMFLFYQLGYSVGLFMNLGWPKISLKEIQIVQILDQN